MYGFSMLDMKRYAEERDYKAVGFRDMSFEDIRYFHAPIVPVRLHGYNHYVVVKGVAPDAVTPEISVSAGVSFAFADQTELDGSKVSGSGFTTGVVELGTGIVLSKDVFLNFTGAFGITDDSPDVTSGISLPVRF